jgi:hypothetical protein
VALTSRLHLAPRLKKEQSYTSTPPLDLRGLFQGELYLYFYLYMISYDWWQKTARGTNVQNAKRKSKPLRKWREFFRLMLALNFLIRKYKSRNDNYKGK